MPVDYSGVPGNQPIPPLPNEEPTEQDTNANAVETKPILMQSNLEQSDVDAMNELIFAETLGGDNMIDLDESIGNNSGNLNQSSALIDPLSLETIEKIRIDDDLEMSFIPGQLVMPKVQSAPMVPKRNDELSGRFPYQAILDHNNVSISS